MASNVFGLFGVKQFKPTAPDKGSFPLDHEGECKVAYLKYMVCLSENAHKNSKCREHPGPRASVLGDITRVYWHPESLALSGPAAPLQPRHGQC